MRELRKHQGGGSTYAEFCALCTRAGVERWEISLPEMVCTYYSRAGEALYAEAIPE